MTDTLTPTEQLPGAVGVSPLAGIAHEFADLLTVITGYSDLLRHGMVSAELTRGAVEEIHSAGRRALVLVRKLQDLG